MFPTCGMIAIVVTYPQLYALDNYQYLQASRRQILSHYPNKRGDNQRAMITTRDINIPQLTLLFSSICICPLARLEDISWSPGVLGPYENSDCGHFVTTNDWKHTRMGQDAPCLNTKISHVFQTLNPQYSAHDLLFNKSLTCYPFTQFESIKVCINLYPGSVFISRQGEMASIKDWH